MNNTRKAMERALEEYLRREMPAGTIIGDTDWWAVKITRAISLPQQGEPVDGWKLVPLEPTAAMLDAYDNDLYEGKAVRGRGDIYAAMLAAAPAAQQVEQPAMLDCDILPRPLTHSLRDYHVAPIDGPLNYTWTDKPHRLLYDLIAAVRYYAVAAPAPQPDARKVIEQMVDALDAASSWMVDEGTTAAVGSEKWHKHCADLRNSGDALKAGQQWLKEHK